MQFKVRQGTSAGKRGREASGGPSIRMTGFLLSLLLLLTCRRISQVLLDILKGNASEADFRAQRVYT